jgi:hypothetical protein
MGTRKNSRVWLFVIAGSAIGGAAGYLLGSGSGRKIRHALTHPDELADNIEDARKFLETKSRKVSDRVHNILEKAKHGIEEGERTYREAGQRIHSRTHKFQGKTVENINRTAVKIEREVVHPLGELGALYRGVEGGIRKVLGKDRSIYRLTGD